jgi:hypothetical protein
VKRFAVRLDWGCSWVVDVRSMVLFILVGDLLVADRLDGLLIFSRSISVAPARGGAYFLCCAKESKQRKALTISLFISVFLLLLAPIEVAAPQIYQ